ncbi:MAG: anthranilate synthase component I, partial [Geobacteraceae bacterium]
MYSPDLQTFISLADKGNLIPVYREIMADMDTPVTAFLKIDDGRYAFLLESIEGGEKWGRYTLLGSNPEVVIRSRGNLVEILENGCFRQEETADPLSCIRDYLGRFTPVEHAGLPRFFGGAVGYLGYDMVRHFELLPTVKPAVIDAYDAYFIITDTILIFDNVSQKIKVVSNAHLDGGKPPAEAYA